MTPTGFIAVTATAATIVLGAAYLRARRLNALYRDALLDAAKSLHTAHAAIVVLDAQRRARCTTTEHSSN